MQGPGDPAFVSLSTPDSPIHRTRREQMLTCGNAAAAIILRPASWQPCDHTGQHRRKQKLGLVRHLVQGHLQILHSRSLMYSLPYGAPWAPGDFGQRGKVSASMCSAPGGERRLTPTGKVKPCPDLRLGDVHGALAVARPGVWGWGPSEGRGASLSSVLGRWWPQNSSCAPVHLATGQWTVGGLLAMKSWGHSTQRDQQRDPDSRERLRWIRRSLTGDHIL